LLLVLIYVSVLHRGVYDRQMISHYAFENITIIKSCRICLLNTCLLTKSVTQLLSRTGELAKRLVRRSIPIPTNQHQHAASVGFWCRRRWSVVMETARWRHGRRPISCRGWHRYANRSLQSTEHTRFTCWHRAKIRRSTTAHQGIKPQSIQNLKIFSCESFFYWLQKNKPICHSMTVTLCAFWRIAFYAFITSSRSPAYQNEDVRADNLCTESLHGCIDDTSRQGRLRRHRTDDIIVTSLLHRLAVNPNMILASNTVFYSGFSVYW